MKNNLWRLIPYSTHSAGLNMALDEAIAESVVAGVAVPTLRFYGWTKPSITIGAFQKISDINLSRCNELEIAVVRRPTGGRAILHGNELTYSFSSVAGKFGRTHASVPFTDNLLNNYRLISTAFLRAVKSFGIDAVLSQRRLKRKTLSLGNPLCFASTSFSELTVSTGGGGYKVMGAAQKRYDGGFLEQGSIPLSTENGLLKELFTEADGLLLGLNYFNSSITIELLMSGVISAFEETFDITLKEGHLTNEEQESAELHEKKYHSDNWTLRR
ncbi:lipoate--protein ligase family protein [Candidatus Magnetomonas plexicatena]|uniref:lipoate--protein ligase family protein n=1 Tax=Candidatus Magnetomonas plexicatena TaxID=2552947 RepID=UPI001C74E62A|nr:lipoate--protein ligase family protein [Nitrospirales bacterium LBB_01]